MTQQFGKQVGTYGSPAGLLGFGNPYWRSCGSLTAHFFRMSSRKSLRDKELGDLRARLKRERGTKSLAAIASEAQVATKTLTAIEGGPNEFPDRFTNTRLRAGLSESVTRLSIHFGINPSVALDEFGLDEKDPFVIAGKERARRGVRPPQMVADRALADIERRSIETGVPSVRVGLLAWPPFHEIGDADDGESFAEKFMRTLLTSVNPGWQVDPATIPSIGEAISGLIEREPMFDVVFGLYDTSYRRQLGLDFIPVPGIDIKLGALAQDDLSWADHILDPVARSRPVAVVLKEEAGFHVLRGAAGYPLKDLIQIDNNDPRVVARELLIASQRTSGPVVFVADAFSCMKVLSEVRELRGWQEKWPAGLPLPSEPQLASYRIITRGLEWIPKFPVGIAVRADSQRFRDLLVGTMRFEMFGHGRLRTARMYNDLFGLAYRSGAVAESLCLDARSFDALGLSHQEDFKKAWKHLVMRGQPSNHQAAAALHPEVKQFLKLS